MVQKDMGIEYHAKLKEVKANIKKLEDLNLDMSRFKGSVRIIEKELDKKVKGSYQSFDTGSATAFLYDSLTGDYGQSIKKLDAINDALKREWETYYKISSSSRAISYDMKDVDEDSIKEIASSTLRMLEELKSSTTIDFNVEKDIVYQVYGIVYKVMQLEFIFSNDSILFDALSNNSVDIPYMVEFMKDDISHIDEKDKGEITSFITKLEKEGLDDSHLFHKNLIILLSLYHSSSFPLKKKEQFLRDLDSLTFLRIDVDNEKCHESCTSQELEELRNDKRVNTKKGITKRIAILLNTILVSCGIVAGAAVLGEATKEEQYHTITTTYDSSLDDFSVEESFEKGKEGSLEMVEYSPWDAPGYFRDEYVRNRYTYNMNSIPGEREDISSYLDSELKNSISFTSGVEKSDSIPEDYGYSENKYVITRVEKDLDEDVQRVRRPWLWALSSLLFGGGVITADFFLFRKLSKEKLKVIRDASRNTKKRIISKSEEARESSKRLEELLEKEEKEFERMKDAYDLLPIAIKNSPDVRDAVKKYLKK